MQIKTLLMEIGQRSAFGPQILDHPAADICEISYISRKTSSQKYREKHAETIAFRGFLTVFSLPVIGVHSPLRRVVHLPLQLVVRI